MIHDKKNNCPSKFRFYQDFRISLKKNAPKTWEYYSISSSIERTTLLSYIAMTTRSPLHKQYNIRKRQLPSCPAFKSKASNGIASSKQFTRHELEDASRRFKRKDIAAMAASRQRAILTVQKQRETQKRETNHVDSSGQMRSLDVGVKLCARKYNDAKAEADKLEDEVRSRCDDLIGLEREAKALHEMLEGNNSDARKITQLSAEIEETNKNSDRILLYRHQLNFMRQRVQKNSVTMDCHIEEISDTLSSAEKEREWRKKMLAEVENGLTCAAIELEETTQDARIAENRRTRELHVLRTEAEDAAKMEEWNRERMNTNLALHESFRDTNKDERERLQKAMRERKAQLQVIHKSLEENAVRLGEVDECFAHIKHSTGVNSLKEMIMKTSQHDATRQRLLMERKDSEERLKEAKLSLLNDQALLDKMKTSGIGDVEWNRDVLDKIQASIADERAEVKITKSANERLGELLVGIRQGSNGLFNRLLPFHSTLFLTESAPKFSDIDLTNATQVASEVLEVIQFTEKTLGKILSEIGGIRLVPKLDAGSQSRPQTPGQADLNCRVSPKASTESHVSTRDKAIMEDTPTRKDLKSDSESLREQHRTKHPKNTQKKVTLYTSPKKDINDSINSVLEDKINLD